MKISARFGALWLLAPAMISGLVVIGFGSVRWGGFVISGALFVGALLRLVLPAGRAGGLVVRSRPTDVMFLLGMAVALFVIVFAVELAPRG